MTLKKEVEFNIIVNDILKCDEFIDLKYEIHHGISRLEHSLNVAKLTYLMCKFLHIKKLEETTRAALLHDFFKDKEVKSFRFLNHPDSAINNASLYFQINDFQKNIIGAHMFPVTKVLPKYKESWLVSLSDKIMAVNECLRYKVPLTIGATFLFFVNFCIIQR